jgi:hypothetical protein
MSHLRFFLFLLIWIHLPKVFLAFYITRVESEFDKSRILQSKKENKPPNQIADKKPTKIKRNVQPLLPENQRISPVTTTKGRDIHLYHIIIHVR